MSAEADLAFHASIAEASGNDFYLGVLRAFTIPSAASCA